MMWALVITMVSTVGIQEPIKLSGPPDYPSYGDCAKYGERIVDWLSQDLMKVKYSCEPIQEKEYHDEETKIHDTRTDKGVY